MLKESESFKLIDASFPHIGKRIFVLWGRADLIPYLNDLIIDARDDPALGFSTAVEAALHGLRERHDRDFPRQLGQPERHVLSENDQFKTVNTAFRRIGRRLKDLWGGPELSAYINTLLQDTRDGTRQGFPPEVATALFRLMQKHDADFPEHVVPVADIWILGKGL